MGATTVTTDQVLLFGLFGLVAELKVPETSSAVGKRITEVDDEAGPEAIDELTAALKLEYDGNKRREIPAAGEGQSLIEVLATGVPAIMLFWPF